MDDAFVDPDRDQFAAFKALDRDQPINMLNLVRLRDQAAYFIGHDLADKGLSGAEAYASYGRESGPVFSRVGGRIVWRGSFQTTLIGPTHDAWDHMFTAYYPSASAFLEMISDPTYRQAVVHRQAAVLTSRLIRCAPGEDGDTFG